VIGGDFEGSGLINGLVVATDHAIIRLRPQASGTAWVADVGGDATLAFGKSGDEDRILAVTRDGRIFHLTPKDGRQLKEIRTEKSEEGIREIRLADFNGDGLPDVYVFDIDGHTTHVHDGMHGKLLQTYHIPQNAQARHIADLNGDGRPDMLLTPEEGEAFVCFSGTTKPGGADPLLWSLNPEAGPWGFSVYSTDLLDIDGDGRREVVSIEEDSSRKGGVSGTVRWRDPRGVWVETVRSGRRWEGAVIRSAVDGKEFGTVELGSVGGLTRALLACPRAAGSRVFFVLMGTELLCCSVPSEEKGNGEEGKEKGRKGKVLWRFDSRDSIGAVVKDPHAPVEEAKILVGDEGGDLYSLRIADGERVWARRLGRPIRHLAFRRRKGVNTGEILALGLQTASLLSAEAREVIWEVTLPDRVQVPNSPGFRFIFHLDGNGLEDLIVPLRGGRIMGIVPGKVPFRKRPIAFRREDELALGAHMVAAGRHETALSWLDRLLAAPDISPDLLVRTWFQRGEALKGLKKEEEALEAYHKALSVNPDDPETRVELGLLLASMKRNEEAVGELTTALQRTALPPRKRNQALIARARARQALGKTEEAIADFTAYLEENPRSRDARFEKAQALHALGHWPKVIEDCKKSLQQYRWDSRFSFLLARAYACMGMNDQAVEALQQAVKSGFNDLRAFWREPDLKGLRELDGYKTLLEILQKRQRRDWEEEEDR
jgi:tetratricopeptide (TPR) repeat protein/outer membrane protein assembly factor BamB